MAPEQKPAPQPRAKVIEVPTPAFYQKKIPEASVPAKVSPPSPVECTLTDKVKCNVLE